jgi:putative redox protein
MSVEMDIIYQGKLHCEAKHQPSGATIITDAPVDIGGKGEAFSPTDLVGVALGTCMVTSMATFAQRHNIELQGATVHVEKIMTATPPRRIDELKIVLTFPQSKNLSLADRTKLERAASACPVGLSLHPDVKISAEYR